jgi:RNA polymerase sigma-70 factor, ECF subfamily
MSHPGPVRGGVAEDVLSYLMTAYQAGRLDAFEELYLALAGELRAYFIAATHDGTAAQDMTQEAFLQVHRVRHLYRPPLPVRPWVFGIARNVLRRHRRVAWRHGRRQEASVAAAAELVRSADGARGAVEPRDLSEALEKLPKGGRDAFLLHHVHGFSFRQVADMLRIREAAAKLRSSRAMKALRSSLGIDARSRS